MAGVRGQDSGFIVGLALVVLFFLGIVAYGTLLIAGRESVAPVIEKRAYEGFVMAETGLKQAMFGLLDETTPPIGDDSGAFTPGIDVSLGSAGSPTDLLAGDPEKMQGSFENDWVGANKGYVERLGQIKAMQESLPEAYRSLPFMLATLFLDNTPNPANPSLQTFTDRRIEVSTLQGGQVKNLLTAIEGNSALQEVVGGNAAYMRRWEFIRLSNMREEGGNEADCYDFAQETGIQAPGIAKVYIARGVLVNASTYERDLKNHPRLLAVAFFGPKERLGMKAVSVELMIYEATLTGTLKRVSLQESKEPLQNGVCWFGSFREELFGIN
jgi:hypothetical protein